MKSKAIALFTAAVCVAFSVNIVQATSQLELGIKGGLGFATFTGDATGAKSYLVPGGGALLRISPSPQVAIQTEFLLSQKGSGVDGTDERFKFTYFEIPILAMYRPPVKGTISPAFFAGPAIGFIMSAKAADNDIKDQLNSSDLGITFGLGLDVKTGAKGAITFDARLTKGLSNIVKASSGTLKNSLVFFSIGYLFQVGQ